MDKKWPAIREFVGDVCNFVFRNVCLLGLPAKEARRLELAVEEVFINVTSYGRKQGGASIPSVRITIKKDKDKLMVRLIDNGPEFNPLMKEDPPLDSSLLERPIGGLGIFLVKGLVDDVAYKRDGEENILTLTKYMDREEKEYEDYPP